VVSSLGMEYLGMTGKFHTMWGEFGGYKRPEALEYECALMAALGARCSIGDQLPPSGAIDEATYATIAPGYARVRDMEPFLENAQSAADMAVLSSDAVNGTQAAARAGSNISDDGAVRMLLELQLMFDVIDTVADFEKYQLLILPDDIELDAELAEKLPQYVAGGGALILSGSSGMECGAERFGLPLSIEYSGTRRSQWPDYLSVTEGFGEGMPSSPIAMYECPYLVKAGNGAKVLAKAHEPYFDRNWRHFCSHQHAPARPEPEVSRDAVIRDGKVIYFAHPIFAAYARSGQPLYRDLLRDSVHLLVERPVVEVKMPSAARVSLMKQDDPKRLLLHLLYAQPQLRGRGHTMTNGNTLDVEVIEDPVPLHSVQCSVAVDDAPSRVYHASSGKNIEYEYSDGYVRFNVEEVYIHELLAIEE
ncbi:MAG: beta-galactosidase trimerization domain-containing protein, partial [Spirochaetia bacterium]